MSISQAMLPEFDIEMLHTRKLLALIPEDKLDWQAHEKSMTLRGIATHLANLPSWTMMTISNDEFDMAPKEPDPSMKVPPVESVAEALKSFDDNVAAAHATIEGASDGTMMDGWTLLSGGEKVFTMPKVAVMRSFVLSHMIHHRAQLGVYLRMCDVPLPAIYGNSADETPGV